MQSKGEIPDEEMSDGSRLQGAEDVEGRMTERC